MSSTKTNQPGQLSQTVQLINIQYSQKINITFKILQSNISMGKSNPQVLLKRHQAGSCAKMTQSLTPPIQFLSIQFH